MLKAVSLVHGCKVKNNGIALSVKALQVDVVLAYEHHSTTYFWHAYPNTGDSVVHKYNFMSVMLSKNTSHLVKIRIMTDPHTVITNAIHIQAGSYSANLW